MPHRTALQMMDASYRHSFCRILLGKESHACRITMQEVSATDRPDFTLRKKSCQRNRAQPVCHGRCVVIGPPKQAPSASAATEHEGSQRLMAMCSPIGGQQQIQVL